MPLLNTVEQCCWISGTLASKSLFLKRTISVLRVLKFGTYLVVESKKQVIQSSLYSCLGASQSALYILALDHGPPNALVLAIVRLAGH